MKFDLKSRKQETQIQEETVPDNVPDGLKSSYETIWGQSGQKVIDVELNRLFPYKKGDGGQPYSLNERKISQIAASATDIGIITPLQIREIDGGNYEIISGHHRYEAAKRIGLLKVPCVVVRNVSDEQVFQMMSESNIQRDKILPSEYGKIFTVYHKRKKDIDMTATEIKDKFGISFKTMYRYIDIAKMINVIQIMFDEKQINVCAIDNIKGFSEDTQNALYQALSETGVKLSVELSKSLKELVEALEEDGADVTAEDFIEALTGISKPKSTPTFTNKVYANIHKKHNVQMTEKELDELTAKLLDEYFSNMNK